MIDKRIVLDIGELYSRCAQSRDLSDMLSQIQSWRGQDILLTGEAPPWFCVWLAVRLRDGAGWWWLSMLIEQVFPELQFQVSDNGIYLPPEEQIEILKRLKKLRGEKNEKKKS